jgi:hypothetical protein
MFIRFFQTEGNLDDYNLLEFDAVYLEERNETGMLLLPFSGYRATIRQSLCQLTEVLGVVQISLARSHFAFITNSSYVHVSSLEGFFLLGKEERCHQTTTFRN